jgi:bacillithiol biosynthesis cysteine-adding enzyme BshC
VTVRFEPLSPPRAPLGLASYAAARAAQAGRAFPPAAADALLVAGAGPDGEPAARARDALLSGQALAVTTGQQPGLFTGPLYTIYKALTAAALAEALATRWAHPVVPVFWVAGDDHDFVEINHCAVVASDGTVQTIVLRERPADAPMLPAYREAVGPEVGAALAALEAALPPNDFRAATMSWLGAAYLPERSMAEAHAAALAELLAPFGVVICRGWDASLKRAAGPLVLDALRAARPLDEALAREAARLRDAGEAPPVAVGDGMGLAMVEGAGGRDRLRIAEAGFVTRRSGERFLLADLEAMVRATPGRLSANVLLRPVVEAQLLPTVAYVGGPAELGYLQQVVPLFAHLAVPRPVPTPRVSGFIVEAKVAKTLERFGLTPADLGRPEGELASAIAREALPADAAEALAALRAALDERYAAVQEASVRIERTLERPVETARNQAVHGVDEIEKRLVAALKRNNETTLQQLARARGNLWPGGHAQERVLTVANYLARHGRPLLAVLQQAARDHVERLLEAAPSGA